MNTLIAMTDEEKRIATDATDAADELLELWGYIQNDRVRSEDLKAARQNIAVLIRFGRLVQQKLLPEAVEMADPTEQTKDASNTDANRPVEKLFGSKGFRGFVKRLFG